MIAFEEGGASGLPNGDLLALFFYVNISYSALTYRELRDVVPCFDGGSHCSYVTLTVASEGFSDVIY